VGVFQISIMFVGLCDTDTCIVSGEYTLVSRLLSRCY
jgi:NADH:ubiquinone oxidoreductase subunit E